MNGLINHLSEYKWNISIITVLSTLINISGMEKGLQEAVEGSWAINYRWSQQRIEVMLQEKWFS